MVLLASEFISEYLVALPIGCLAALLWANSPWPDSYSSAWETQLTIRLGDHALGQDLRGWVNQGLMTLFFLVVGLEAKRELDLGELRERTRLAIPVVTGGLFGHGTRNLALPYGALCELDTRKGTLVALEGAVS